jgi:hypothetical protein
MIGIPALSDIVGGMDARIQRLPSSSVGKNSLPSRDPMTPLPTRKSAPSAMVIVRFAVRLALAGALHR